MLSRLALLLMLPLAACQANSATKPAPATLRVATYNSSLNDDRAGGLISRLEAGDDNARRIAAVIQHQRPDLLLVNEFDYDPGERAADLFQREYLEKDQFGQQAIHYAYRYLAPVNTGVPSGMDLDNNGKIEGGNDAWGFGKHPGQYGMLVLSRYPIDAKAVRSFQLFKWKDLPGAKSPIDPKTGKDWYAPEVWKQLRLSSKSHWDVPVQTPLGLVHFLVDHPTPPVFDGPEDRNGLRNVDEIRLWAEYISGKPAPWLCDDRGQCGGLPSDQPFVIAGDHNADPIDGDSTGHPMDQLLGSARVLRYAAPESNGAVESGLLVGRGNIGQKNPPAQDTGNFGPRIGNLRLDYVLPSQEFRVIASGVFWPKVGETGSEWIDVTDHHMVWLDLTR
jgi:endonuclease/exonuclease/phosphatase family metal-dependent hydrolase